MVEILFSRNLIKVLFATETFAMGVNMPCRCVVFNSIRKHDGTQFRVLEPGEYTQMAGRAGRRGLDKVGTVIMCCFGETPPPMPILRNLLTGSSTRLSSQFRLTYSMILNLLRVEDMSVEGMIKRSFSEFATQRALTANEYPKLLSRGVKTLAKLDEEFKQDANNRIGAEDLENYYNVCSELKSLNADLLSYIVKSVGSDGGGAFIPGRVMLVNAARMNGYVRAPAILLRQPVLPGSSSGRSGEGSGPKPAAFIVLLPESYIASIESSEATESRRESRRSRKSDKPGTIGYVGSSRNRYYAIHEVDFDDILLVSFKKHKVDASTLLKEDTQVTRAGSGFGGHFSKLDPFANSVPVSRRGGNDFDAFAGMKPKGKKMDSPITGSSSTSAEEKAIESIVCHLIEAEKRETDSNLQVMDLRDCVKQGNDLLEFRQQCGHMEELVIRMRSFSSHRHPNIEGHFAALERKETLRSRVETLRHLLSNESLELFPDFLQRKSLLLTSGYIDDNETVCVKGRVACEVNTCEELIVTEMVLEGVLNELEPAEIVAALSALVYQEKSSDDEFDAELPEQLVMCCQQMKTIATNLGQLQKDHGLEIDPAEYCDASLKFGLVHVVYEWALGVPFSSICELTLVQEGSIVRCITRLDELCREVRNCARVVGNPTLYRKMEAASMAIKRDIVFASSLYVS
jgi:antiviral helicase SKI2